MLKYLKAAFFLRVPIPVLGAMPLNLIGLVALGILGFGQPAFWLLGAGMEMAYLFLLSTNARFQRIIKGIDLVQANTQIDAKRRSLISQLGPAFQQRLTRMEARCNKILDLYRSFQVDTATIGSNLDVFRYLQWIYLKLLVAQHYLQSPESQANETDLKARIASFEQELAAQGLSDSIRQSKSATLDIFRRRLENLQRRAQSLQEIDSELARIDAQLDLAMENATMQGQPQAISTNIDLASHLLDDSMFGQSQSAIADLDPVMGQSQAAQAQ